VVTAEQVTQAYRLFLCREPESADVVASYCQATQTLDQLSRIFASSPEFLRRMGSTLEKAQSARHRHSFCLPKIAVETQVSPEALEQMFGRIHQQWEQLGATEPFWSVVTQPQHYMAEFELHREHFYASGNALCKTFLATLRRCGLGTAQRGVCLEVGCGVGRVTGHLAGAFHKIIAADISSRHLALAHGYLEGRGIDNVEYQHWPTAEHMQRLGQVDAIFCVITLQHNPPPVMAWMLMTLLARLGPGGVAYFQIPTYRTGYVFEAERYLASKTNTTMEMHYLPQPEVFRLLAEANCQCVEVREDGMAADDDQLLSSTFMVQKC
jgi:2-polyprenyl-3-methyl-5-hydroxy-6-metoxy-1,4-benzoquinol methylase